MNDNANSTKKAETQASQATQAKPAKSSAGGALSKVTAFACVVLAVLLALQWWTARTETMALRAEIARRLQLGDNQSKEVKTLASAVHERVLLLRAKVKELEIKQAEAIADQDTLSQIYKNISKNRDEWALAEVENVLSTASQQLQLSGNIQGALIALKNAEENLSRLNKPHFAPILSAIKEDIKKLHALPEMDLTGAAVRLDEVIEQIDQLPLVAERMLASQEEQTNKPEPVADSSAEKAGSGESAEWWRAYLEKAKSWSRDMAGDLNHLVRIRQADDKDVLLVSPDQAYFIRENLKLRLLSARLALLSRNEAIFSGDMGVVHVAITRYFDAHDNRTKTVLETLSQVKASKLRIQMPALESLTAVYNFKSKS